jgi:hypothetical protein
MHAYIHWLVYLFIIYALYSHVHGCVCKYNLAMFTSCIYECMNTHVLIKLHLWNHGSHSQHAYMLRSAMCILRCSSLRRVLPDKITHRSTLNNHLYMPIPVWHQSTRNCLFQKQPIVLQIPYIEYNLWRLPTTQYTLSISEVGGRFLCTLLSRKSLPTRLVCYACHRCHLQHAWYAMFSYVYLVM